MSETVRKIVLRRISRQDARGRDWIPGSSAVICNLHYEERRGPSAKDKNILPTVFSHKTYRTSRLSAIPEIEGICASSEDFVTADPVAVEHNDDDVMMAVPPVCEEECQRKDCAELRDENAQLRIERSRLQVALEKKRFCIDSLTSDAAVKFHTGIVGLKTFNILWAWLEPAAKSIVLFPSTKGVTDQTVERIRLDHGYPARQMSGASRKICLQDEFFMVLLRLRLGLYEEDLAYRFGVSIAYVSKVMGAWLPFLFKHFSKIISWPQTTAGPKWDVLAYFPNTVAAIDCTEIFTEKPRKLSTQKATFSSYKNHTTVNYLAAIDLYTGSFVYMSSGFPGCTSDRKTVEKSGLLELVKPGQRILADRGFKVADLLAERQAFLSIPSFLKGRAQLTGQEALYSRKLASARVHVERAFVRLREFHYINRRQNNSTTQGTLDQIMIITAALVNLQVRLIGERH